MGSVQPSNWSRSFLSVLFRDWATQSIRSHIWAASWQRKISSQCLSVAGLWPQLTPGSGFRNHHPQLLVRLELLVIRLVRFSSGLCLWPLYGLRKCATLFRLAHRCPALPPNRYWTFGTRPRGKLTEVIKIKNFVFWPSSNLCISLNQLEQGDKEVFKPFPDFILHVSHDWSLIQMVEKEIKLLVKDKTYVLHTEIYLQAFATKMLFLEIHDKTSSGDSQSVQVIANLLPLNPHDHEVKQSLKGCQLKVSIYF